MKNLIFIALLLVCASCASHTQPEIIQAGFGACVAASNGTDAEIVDCGYAYGVAVEDLI